MLIPRQWARLVGSVVAAFLFIALLHNLEVLRRAPQLFRPSAETQFGDEKTALPYRPPEEDLESRPKGEGDGLFGSGAIATSTSEDVPATLESGTTSLEQISHPDPQSPTFRKSIVMGKLLSEDTDWVSRHVSDWNNTIYVVDTPKNETSPTGHRTKVNKAKEATPYLTYIVEHYDDFPDVAAFIHSHRSGWPQAWHNDAPEYDAVTMLHRLRLDTVLERGYVNLRCSPVPGCPAEIDLLRDPPDPDKPAEAAYPFVFGKFFNITIDEVREQVPIIATPCCAQFAVSREQVRQRPKAEYKRYLDLIETSDYDDQTLGTVMEYMWHILFGRAAVHCEDVLECYSAIYGPRKGW